MLWSCAGAGTAFVLGVDWLAEPVAGVPAGLWLVGGAIGLAELHARGIAERWARGLTAGRGGWGGLALPSLPWLSLGGWGWPRGFKGDELRSAFTDITRRAGSGLSGGTRLGEKLGLGSVDGVQTVRIGVDLTEREFKELAPEESVSPWIAPGVRVRWFRVPSGQFSAAREDLAAHKLDALVRRQIGGSVFAFFAERPGKPAAWLDWNADLPLSYPGLFPSRFDAAQVELAGWTAADGSTNAVARELVTSGAVLSRTAARLKPARVFKDRTLDGPEVAEGVSDRALHALADAFLDYARRPFPRPAASAEQPGLIQAAGRLLAAWASSNEQTLGASDREALLTAASEGMEHEPVQVLRLATAQFAAGQDEQGMRSLLWARRRLRSAGSECVSEPLAFVQSEIEMGRPGGLSLGRIAAGLTLLWATSPAEQADYLRDDISDDLRHSGWLSGRKDDLAVIERVMNELERADANEFELRPSMAA